MKKLLIVAAATLLSSMNVVAQSTIQLPYFMSIELKNNTWESWPQSWQSSQKEYNFVPNVTIRKVDSEIYSVEFYFGGSASGIFKENVIYDATESAKIRKNHSNNSLNAYRFTGSKDYIWTDQISLADLSSTPSKWTTTANAKIYTWQYSLGSATVYTATAPAQPAKKYAVNFNANKKKIKGTWGEWSSWSTVKNAHFELKVMTEGRVFNFKYYENGKMVKNYDITYDDTKTKSLRGQNEKISCYKINGTKDNWIYLLNTSMTIMLGNPDKWSKENDAIVVILDDEKSGQYTRIK